MRLIFFLIFLFPALGFFAQQQGHFITESQLPEVPFTIVHYDTKHGLPQNQIIDLIAKKNGNLLISTANGIVEYNGYQFNGFVNSPAYNKQMQHRLYWHEGSGKLFGTDLGGRLNNVYPEYSFIRMMMSVGIYENTIAGIDPEGNLWKGEISGKTFKKIAKTGIITGMNVLAEKNGCYVSGNNKLIWFEYATGKQTVLAPEIICRIRKNPYNGKVYAPSLFNHLYYEISPDRTVKIISLNTSLPKDALLTDIAFTEDGTFFITSSAGLIQIKGKTTVLYNDENIMPTRQLECMYYNSAERCLFIGTGLNGLLKLTMKSCESYYDPDNIGNTSVTSLLRTSNGELLAAGYRGTIFGMTDKGFEPYFVNKSHFASLAEIDGTIYAGTWGEGVVLIKNAEKIGIIPKSQLPGDCVYCSFKDSRGTIWIGTNHGIAKGTAPGNIQPLLASVMHNNINNIYELKNGNICIASVAEIYLLNPFGKLIRKINEKDGLKCKEVRSFYEDQEGKLWIGTYGGGLYCLEKGKLRSINNMPNCGLYPDVFTLLPDGDNLLITSNMGLWSVNRAKLDDFYDGRLSYLIPFFYGEESGVRNTEFNGGKQNCFVREPNGGFYLPSIQGVVYKKPGDINFKKLHPLLQALYVDDTLSPKDLHMFKRSTRSVSFRFFCANYNSIYNLHYQYKLTGPGLANEWSRLGKSGTIDFDLLPPGNYQLSVRCIDGFNDSDPLVSNYSFSIRPYFYETFWFRLLTSLVVILLAIFIIRSRYIRAIRKKTHEDHINNTILELKLSAIQSKMDPHFIFNSLNTIMYMLDAQKYTEAEELLQEFSLLIRRFLEVSDNTFLTILEEMQIIELYLAIEQKRCNNSFTYTIDYPPELAAKIIPTHLIQPLVENAVKHGVLHSEQRCSIAIRFALQGQDLHIYLDDNGIGRKRSAEINRTRRNHVSRGTNIVTDKIAVMRERYNVDIEMEIRDVDSDGRTGTAVHFRIKNYNELPAYAE